MGLGHSEGKNKSGKFVVGGDHTDFMGYNLGMRGRTNLSRCFNFADSWTLGWYSDRSKVLDVTSNNFSKWNGVLVGIADYKRNRGKDPVILRLVAPSTKKHYYVGFNRKTGINADTNVANDGVTVTEKSDASGTTRDLSYLHGILKVKDQYIIRDFDGRGIDLRVTYKSLNKTSKPYWRAFVRVERI